MKTKPKILSFLILVCMLSSCNDSTVKKEVTTIANESEPDRYYELNNRLKQAKNINTPIDLIKYYYGEVDDEKDIDIKVDKFEENQYKIQLVQQNIKDDSIAGMTVIMFAQRENANWTVQDIQRKWKCQKGRGHSEFSSEPCL